MAPVRREAPDVSGIGGGGIAERATSAMLCGCMCGGGNGIPSGGGGCGGGGQKAKSSDGGGGGI